MGWPFNMMKAHKWSPRAGQTGFVAPEVFLGPFKSPISDGTRVALGVSFNVLGDAVHAQTYTITHRLRRSQPVRLTETVPG
jgi:hypothetical protein